MDMGKRIKSKRLELGYTQEELAAKVGLQKSAIAKYENGRVENMKRSMILKMAEELKCTPAYLMGWESASTKRNFMYTFPDGFSFLVEFEQSSQKEQADRLNRYTDRLNRYLDSFPKYASCSEAGQEKINKYIDNVFEMEQAEKEVSVEKVSSINHTTYIHKNEAPPCVAEDPYPYGTGTSASNDNDYLTPVAAHNDDTSEEQIDLMRQDLDEL